MKSNSVVFVNTIFQVIGKIVLSSFGFITTYFLTRHLGTLGFSEYSFIFTFIIFLHITSDLGLTPYLIREAAKKKSGEKSIVASVFTLRFIASLIAAIILALLITIFPYSHDVKLGIVIALIAQTLLNLSNVIWALFQARLEFRKIIFAQVVGSLVFLIAVLYGVSYKFGLIYFVLANTFASLVGFFASIKFVGRGWYFFTFDRNKLQETFLRALPFGLWVLVGTAYFKADVFILSLFYNPSHYADVGYYSLAYRLFEVTIVFGGFFTQVLYAYLSSLKSVALFKKTIRYYVWYSLGISVIGAISIYFLAKPIILILGGVEFLPSVSSAMILSAAAFATILAGFFLSIAFVKGRQNAVLISAAGALVLNILLNLFIIPNYSYIGASITTVVTQFVVLLANIYITKSEFLS